MKWLWRLLALSLILAGGIWLWITLHPTPEKMIRSRLRRLADQVSFTRDESELTRLGKISGVTSFFTEEVEIKLAFREFVQRGNVTHEMLQAGAVEFRKQMPRGLKVEFLDVIVTHAPGADFATAELTMKATMPGDSDFNVQEMKFALHKLKDNWLIYRVETVRTLK